MMQNESPAAHAFRRLSALARDEKHSDALLFALVWLAAGRMVSLGKAAPVSAIDELVDLVAWKSLREAGFPVEAYDLIATSRATAGTHDVGRRATAAGIVAELQRELGEHLWDVLPSFTDSGARRGFEPLGMVVPQLAALLLDLVGQSDGGELWIPFDFAGQLTVSALRRGWSVLTASPISAWTLVPQLLLTIESGHPQHPKVRNEVERDASGRPITRADYILAMPPFGVQVKDSRMGMWDSTGGRGNEQFARSESWAIHEFVNRANKRAVFVAPQGVLFAKGQEQRLREYLLHRGGECNEVESVIALPPGVFSVSAIAGAVLVVNPGGHRDDVRMVDLGSGRRSLLEAGDIVEAGHNMALGREQPADRVRQVTRDEIAANEYSFAPSRYLRRVADLGTSAVKLGDVCEAIRPPATVKEASPFEAAEVGMSDLNEWGAIKHRVEKTVYLKVAPKDAVLVQPGDIIFSIKGTVGKAALMGDVARERPTVVSQSCLSLRLASALPSHLSPEFVLMYLRSPHGKAQLEGLQVGAGVQHISPSTLLSSVLIPVPTEETLLEVHRDYERLCLLEHQVAEIEDEIAVLTRRRWSAET